MKRHWLIGVLAIALLLAACADGGAAQTPGALGTEPVLGTDTGLETAAVTDVVEPTLAVTTEATAAATTEPQASPVVEVTAEVETGLVAAPYDMFTVASRTGETGIGTGDDVGGGDAVATLPAGTQPAAEGTMPAADATQPATTGTQPAGMETEQERLLVRASELLGSDIVDETGAMVDIVFDASDFLGTGTGTGGDTGGDTGGTGATTPEPLGTLDASTQVVGTIEPVGTTDPLATVDPLATSTVGEGTAMPETGVVADENTILVFNGTASMLETEGLMLPQTALDADGMTIDSSAIDIPAGVADLQGLVRISRVTDGGAEVMDGQDQSLGEVEDLLLDIRQGMVEYGVVDFGGFLGIAENTVAVPWSQFSLNTAAGADANLMLDVSADTLENAPRLNTGEWPSWPEPIPMEWETETQTFWETAS